MSTQRGLFDKTIDQRFAEFHAANPNVFARIVELLREAKHRGKTRTSLKMIFEVLRWESYLYTARDPHEFKLNNSYTSRYSRLVIELYPELGALLETRRLLAA